LSLNYFRIANLSANNSANNSANAKVAGVRMMFRKLQQVSAAFASRVNPKASGGRNLSLLAKNDDGPESVAGAGKPALEVRFISTASCL